MVRLYGRVRLRVTLKFIVACDDSTTQAEITCSRDANAAYTRTFIYGKHPMSISKNKRAFSLVELVIVIVIIGVIAAIAVPRISRGAKGAGDAALRGSLAGLRNAIDMYAAEHNGTFPPGADQAAVETQMTTKTKADGTAGGKYGPYLRSGFPPLSVCGNKGSSTVIVLAAGSPVASAVTVGTGEGWIYSTATGEVIANCLDATIDEDSVLYNTY